MINVIFGILALVYGLFTLIMRLKKGDSAFDKVARMKEIYGEKAGNIIHVVSYTLLPILFGIVVLVLYFVCGIEVF